MQVYAFVGKTGTGKSYRAQTVAHKYGINYIIDDALLVKGNKVLYGKSAKTEATKIASVKSAIFLDEEKANKMADIIKKENVDKILILGTSDEMVEKIALNLKLPEILKTVYITDIATYEEITAARKSRFEEGKHVVPVPTFEIKEQFSGYFLDPLKILNIFSKQNEPQITEKTIIRPTYSYLGKFSISEKVINSIIEYIAKKVEGISKVYRINTIKHIDGMKIEIDVEIIFGVNIPKLNSNLQNAVIYALNNATGINIFGISVGIKGISKIDK